MNKDVPAPLPRESELVRCLDKGLQSLPVSISQAPLQLYVRVGKITKARLGGGLVLPACAKKLLLGARFGSSQEGVWLERPLSLR